MNRVTFAPAARVYAARRVVEAFNDYYARVLVAPHSPNRAGERIDCIIGEPVSAYLGDEMWVTLVDPSSPDLDAIGEPIQIRAESIHIF
jgi:hypothetical protein